MKLHLGASRLEKLSQETLNVMLNKDWVHLGEDKLHNSNNRTLIKVDYSLTTFNAFYWDINSSLDFDDSSVSFVFSEHFFEHLYLDESISLLKECYRILAPGGVIRTVVPDADLRTHPEILGFPNVSLPNDEPRKHKTRWSYYSLKPILELLNYEVVPIVYFNKHGNQFCADGDYLKRFYGGNSENNILCSLDYVKRKNSLIIDGVKN